MSLHSTHWHLCRVVVRYPSGAVRKYSEKWTNAADESLVGGCRNFVDKQNKKNHFVQFLVSRATSFNSLPSNCVPFSSILILRKMVKINKIYIVAVALLYLAFEQLSFRTLLDCANSYF